MLYGRPPELAAPVVPPVEAPVQAPVEEPVRHVHGTLVIQRAGEDQQAGYIKDNSSLGNCFAVCPLHNDCVKSRTCHASRRGGGHPLGYLAAWCLNAPLFTSKQEHMKHRPSWEERKAARLVLKSQPNYEEFHNFEEGDGPSEPELVPP